MITAGTCVYDDIDVEETYQHRWMVAIIESSSQLCYGVTAIDCTTHEILLDEFKDDPLMTNLRTIIQKLKPVEIVGIRQNISD